MKPPKKTQLSLFSPEESKFTPTLKESSIGAKISHGFLPTSGTVKKAPPKRKSRLDAIYLPEDRKPKTYALEFNEKRQRFLPGSLPLISRSREDVVRIIRENKRIGLDFEYNPSRHYISVVGVAVGNECAACKWDDEIGQLLLKSAKEGGIFVGHFVLGADKPVLEEAMNCTTSLETWDDSMVAHYLCMPHLCVRGDTKVILADGSTKSIENIVSKQIDCEVKCIDEKTGEIVSSRILNYFRSPRGERRIVKLSPSTYLRSVRPAAYVTEDHKILTDRGWRIASEIVGTTVNVRSRYRNFANIQKNVLAGMLLGDSYLSKSKNALSFFNGPEQKEYLDYKREIFAEFDVYPSVQPNGVTRHCFNTVPEIKTIDIDSFVTENFNFFSLLFWYLDDGTKQAKGGINISSRSRSHEENVKLVKLIQERLGISDDEVWLRESPSGRTAIVFSAAYSKRLCAAFSRYAPECMHYKLLEEGSGPFDKASVLAEFRAKYGKEVEHYYPTEVTWSTPRNNNGCVGDRTVYCLETEYGNFLTVGGVVSNCKLPGKSDDGEGGQGFMGLQFAAFFWTNVSGGYKEDRGLFCEGPCPSHDVFGYCAVDAYVGLEAFDRCMDYMDTIGIPRRVYEEHKELALNFCIAAQKRGIFVDLEFAAKLEKEMEKKKEALFPKKGGRFNPRSNIQVLGWFKKHDITLAANDKKTIEDTLEEVLFEKYGVTIGEVGEDLEMDEVTQALYDLYLHKCSGKGLDAWISEKYLTYVD